MLVVRLGTLMPWTQNVFLSQKTKEDKCTASFIILLLYTGKVTKGWKENEGFGGNWIPQTCVFVGVLYDDFGERFVDQETKKGIWKILNVQWKEKIVIETVDSNDGWSLLRGKY